MKLTVDSKNRKRTLIYFAFIRTARRRSIGRSEGMDSFKGPYRTCHLINVHYSNMWSKDLSNHAMGVLAAERE